MPKVKYVKSRKDYPQYDISKGEMYYVWAIKTQRGGITLRSKTPPRQSQLTLSEYKSAAWELVERLEDFQKPSDIRDLVSFRDELVSDAENLRDEQQEKLDNMPEGLQQGDTGSMIQERIEALDSFVEELNGIDFDEDVPDMDEEYPGGGSEDPTQEEWEEERQEKYEQRLQELFDELSAVSLDVG